MERDSFVFYRSFASIYEIDDIAMRDSILHALICYALDGIMPELTGVEKVLFEMMRPQIDANNTRYENGCKGAKDGKKGGAPKGNQNAAKNKKQPQNNPETTRNVNVNANANYNETTVVVNAREAFCKAYGVTVDDTTTDGIDFDALSKAYSESTKFLQTHPAAKRISWAIKHYAEIIAGKYTDFAEHKAPPPTTQTKNNFIVEDD